MAATVLVEPKLSEGRALLEALDRTPVKPFATYWWWDADAEEWQLVIASDMVDNEGPTQALREIQRVLRSEESPVKAVELREVLVVGRHDRRLDFLRGVPLTGLRLPPEPLHIERTVMGGQFVEEAYVYRNVGDGRIVELRVKSWGQYDATVEWRTNASMEVRVSLFRDGSNVAERTIPVQSLGRPGPGSRVQTLTFRDLQPGTSYRIVAESDDDRREVTVKTHPDDLTNAPGA